MLVSNNFSTQTSYENQTKKAITNKFVQEAMTEFLRSNLEIYFIENPFDAEKIGEQVLLNKRSREKAEETRLNVKKKLSGSVDIANRVQKMCIRDRSLVMKSCLFRQESRFRYSGRVPKRMICLLCSLLD